MLHQLIAILLQEEIFTFATKYARSLGNKHYKEITRKICCQEANTKEVALFLINPKNTAIFKKIHFRSTPVCRNGKSGKFWGECPQPPKIPY